jgi:hypothetical protein
MKIDPTKRRRAVVVTIVTLAIVGSGGSAVTGNASPLKAAETRAGDTPVPFAQYQTDGLAGTSETFIDMREDGSYYDPSLGRRVSPKPFWPYQTGAVAGTSETYVDVREDGSYFDASLDRRVSVAR